MTKSIGIGRGCARVGAVRLRRRSVKPGAPLTPAELHALASSHAATALASLADVTARGGNSMSRVAAARLILRLAAGPEEPPPLTPADSNEWGDLLAACGVKNG